MTLPDYKMPRRTDKQNNALHLLFELIADELNSGGYDIKKVIKADVPWSKETVKECLWRPLQEAQLGKKSTTELTRTEIDLVFDTLNRTLGELGISYTPFPSIDEIMTAQQIKSKLS